jgi:hypothetical protein
MASSIAALNEAGDSRIKGGNATYRTNSKLREYYKTD